MNLHKQESIKSETIQEEEKIEQKESVLTSLERSELDTKVVYEIVVCVLALQAGGINADDVFEKFVEIGFFELATTVEEKRKARARLTSRLNRMKADKLLEWDTERGSIILETTEIGKYHAEKYTLRLNKKQTEILKRVAPFIYENKEA